MLSTFFDAAASASEFGVDEMTTKIAILQEEFTHLHDYNPIDHLESRVKSPQSIREKAQRRGIELSIPALRAHITDTAGVRVTCSFTSVLRTGGTGG